MQEVLTGRNRNALVFENGHRLFANKTKDTFIPKMTRVILVSFRFGMWLPDLNREFKSYRVYIVPNSQRPNCVSLNQYGEQYTKV